MEAQAAKRGPATDVDPGTGVAKDTELMLGRLGIRTRKGRYSKKKGKGGHRGGKNKKRKQGFLSEEDFEDESGSKGSAPKVRAAAVGAVEEAFDLVLGGTRGREPGDEEEAKRTTATGEEEDEGRTTATRDEEDSEVRTTATRDEEDSERRTATRMKKTGSRRRTHMVMVEEGRLLRSDKGPK